MNHESMPLLVLPNSMDTAPKDGTRLRLQLRDGYGTFWHEPCFFQGGKWRGRTGKALVPEAIAWTQLRRKQYD